MFTAYILTFFHLEFKDQSLIELFKDVREFILVRIYTLYRAAIE